MQYVKIRTSFKKTAGAAALAGIMALPVLVATPQAAQADPPRYAPSWDRQGYDNRGYDDGGYYRRDDDRRDRGRQRGRGRDRRDRDYRPTYRGVVTSVKSADRFDVNIDGKIYNVYLDRRVPRRLNRGDIVQVNGDRVGKNDIRNADVTIIRNR